MVAVPGRQASGLLCLWRAAQVPWGYLISFSEQPAGWCYYGPMCNGCQELEMASLRCWAREELVWCLYSGAGWLPSTLSSQRGSTGLLAQPPLSLGSCCSPPHLCPGWQDGVSLPILVFPAEISARGFSRGVLGSILLPGCPLLCPLKPQGLLWPGHRGPEGVVDSQCYFPHSEPRVFQP